jgi:hypothetical protein
MTNNFMKKCPFCKKEIESSATECPICKMVLVEKIPSVKAYSNYSNTTPPPKEPKQKAHTSYYTPPPKSSTPGKQFQMPKGSGWVISIIGSIALTAILNYHGAPNPLPAPIATTFEDNNILPSTPVSVAPKTPYRYLPNGTVLFKSPSSFGGPGILSISNGSGSDAVIKLITSGGKKVYSVYIRANNSYSIKNIDDGVYRLLFVFGSDWDSGQKKFLVNPSAEAFDDTFDFETVDNQYVEYSITLNPVTGGKATTNPVDLNIFDKY